MFAKAGKLSAQDLVRFIEECSALSMTSEREEKERTVGESVSTATVEDKTQGTPSG